MYKFISGFYHKHPILSHLFMVGCVALFLCFFAVFFIDVWTNHGSTTTVPEVRKQSYDDAIATLKAHDLKYEIADSVYDNTVPPGTVKETWPHPGTNVKPGRVIYLTVNSFEPQRITVTMPLTGVSSRQAVTYLESLGIKNIRIVYVPSNFPDLVEGARYKGKSITPGTQIPVNADVVLEVGTKRAEPQLESMTHEQVEAEMETVIEDDEPDEISVDEPVQTSDPSVFE